MGKGHLLSAAVFLVLGIFAVGCSSSTTKSSSDTNTIVSLCNTSGNSCTAVTPVPGTPVIYAGTYGCGLSTSTNNGGTFQNFTTACGLGSNYIYGVTVLGSSIYAATGGGLSVSTNSGASWTNYTTANGLGDNYIYNAYASAGTLYASTNSGLSTSTDPISGSPPFTNYSFNASVGEAYVDPPDIYVATAGGLAIAALPVSSSTTWNTITGNGLGGSQVYCVFVQ